MLKGKLNSEGVAEVRWPILLPCSLIRCIVPQFFKHEVWDMDVFQLNAISGNSPLVAAAYHVFKARDLFSEMKIVPSVFLNFISTIEV